MSHLTEGQCEDILRGELPVPDHVEGCPECRALLAEKRALAERLRRTFGAIQASSELVERVRAGVNAPGGQSRPRTIRLAVHRRLWTGVVAAAAVLMIAIPVGLYLGMSSPAHAAQTELVGIHRQNLASMDALFAHEDPAELTGYLERETGHAPAMVCTGTGLTMCGCCSRQFRGQAVGSYVVQGPGGAVSVVIVPDGPESLGMTAGGKQLVSGRSVWRSRCEGCNMASVRIGDRSYCAVGQVSQESLDSVLGSLLD